MVGILFTRFPSWLAAQQTATERVATEGRFTVVASARDQRLARTLLASAVAGDSFPGLPRPRDAVTIVIASNSEAFRALSGTNAPEWGTAVAIPQERRVIMQGSRAGSDAGDPRVVLRHELAHLALHEFLGSLPPRWFDEGYASVAAGEWSRERAFDASAVLVWRTLPSIDSLDAGFFDGASEAEWSYALAHRVVAELEMLDATNGLRNFLVYWKASGSFDVAVRRAYGLTATQFDRHWRQQTKRRYGALSVLANFALLTSVFTLAFGPLYWMRRRRDREKLEAMRRADALQEQALQHSALSALLALSREAPIPPLPPPDGPPA